MNLIKANFFLLVAMLLAGCGSTPLELKQLQTRLYENVSRKTLVAALREVCNDNSGSFHDLSVLDPSNTQTTTASCIGYLKDSTLKMELTPSAGGTVLRVRIDMGDRKIYDFYYTLIFTKISDQLVLNQVPVGVKKAR